MALYRLRRSFIRNRTKIMASFILTTGMTYILIFPNIIFQMEIAAYTTSCQTMDFNQHLQISINQPGLKTDPEVMASDLSFLPGLKNPCWYEMFDERDLEYTRNSPYRFPYNPTFTGPNYLFLDDINRIVDTYTDSLRRNKTTRLRCIPYFYIIGQPKCATSDLYFRLHSHPMVRKGLVKESQWWAWTRQGVVLDNGSTLPLELSDLADLFSFPAMEIETQIEHQCDNKTDDKCQQLIIGDGSIYTWDAAYVNMKTGRRRGTQLHTPVKTPEYIKRLIPDVKLIVIARQPADRLYSAYKYFNKNKLDSSPQDFHSKVVELLERFNQCADQLSALSCAYNKEFREGQDLLISDSLYGLYVEEWLRVIGPNNLIVIRTEDYKRHRRETLRTTFQFLGLCNLTREEEDSVVKMAEVNKGYVDIGPMLSSTRQLLNAFFRPYNEMMVKALKDDRFYWDDYA